MKKWHKISGMLLVATTVLLIIGANTVFANWDYYEKIRAQQECGNRYRQYSDFAACAIGVTLYGDGRRWSEMNWSPQQSVNSCMAVCQGCSDKVNICRDGCNIGRQVDR